MFQDEGRFGLLGMPRRCWAPHGMRPVVGVEFHTHFVWVAFESALRRGAAMNRPARIRRQVLTVGFGLAHGLAGAPQLRPARAVRRLSLAIAGVGPFWLVQRVALH